MNIQPVRVGLLAVVLGGCAAPQADVFIEAVNITYLPPADARVATDPTPSATAVPVVAVPHQSRSYPVCFYDDHFSGDKKAAELERLRKEIAAAVKPRVLVKSVGSRQMVAEGPASGLRALAALWPQLGCIGQPATPADVFKREACQEDMRKRLASASIDVEQSGEGRYYLCAGS
ncbi:hypothetical protein FHW58_003770 [Duganella sp. 1224]|uniref:hypothetical protein n=1 Tax=Duganella sp. 1224 TaxID=2587052 RepID=UPI0015C81917|nr:hypothetical protein [Duganella sp. 1224]NYE62551.1 hypothetical protein [Duganella sp. 1224]